MTKQELNNLIDKVNSGMATDEELRLYTLYLNQITSGTEVWDSRVLGEEEAVKAELHSRIEATRIDAPHKEGVLSPRATASIAWKVAAAVTAITLGVWLYYSSFNPFVMLGLSKHTSSLRAQRGNLNDIAPGRNAATLTLASGEVIKLDEQKQGVVIGAEPAYNDGTLVSPSLRDEVKQSQLLTATTARGQTYQVTLHDGTKVWLNADTKISFPSQFIGKQRKVLLVKGEAYFEVATSYTSLREPVLAGQEHRAGPDASGTKQSFIVQTDKQEVTVLGTHFNINTYDDEGVTKTTLLEGSVSVSSLRGGTTKQSHQDTHHEIASSRRASRNDGSGVNRPIVLKPNQQAGLQGDAITVKQVTAEEVIAWKNGLFTFQNTRLEEVMRQAARWYDVKVVYESAELRQKQLSGSVTRYDNISGLLNAISFTTGVKYKIEGRTVNIRK